MCYLKSIHPPDCLSVCLTVFIKRLSVWVPLANVWLAPAIHDRGFSIKMALYNICLTICMTY